MTLAIFCRINGIGAASGIVYTDDALYLVSDTSTFLYRYSIAEKQLYRIQISETSDEQMLKKNKPDFEILTRIDNDLYLMGSGATPKRNVQVIYNIHSATIKTNDLSQLYGQFKTIGSLTDDELNLEGAFMYHNKWYYFQRGNGRTGTNGIFVADGNNILFHPVALPTIQHVEATFTDAILIDDKAYFLAVAEDSQSTYDDGEILGSLVGSLNLLTMKIDFTQKISDTKKLEGITLHQKTANTIEFLLCEDDDSESTESVIYKLILEK